MNIFEILMNMRHISWKDQMSGGIILGIIVLIILGIKELVKIVF